MARSIPLQRVQEVVRRRICARCAERNSAAEPALCERRCPLFGNLPRLWAVALRDQMVSDPKQALRHEITTIALRQRELHPPMRLPRGYRQRLVGALSELAGLP